MDTKQPIEIHKGLEGVVADSTALSLVDGEGGHLYYRGYPVEALAERRFVEVAWLLLLGELPSDAETDAFEDFLWKAGQLPDDIAANVRALTRLGSRCGSLRRHAASTTQRKPIPPERSLLGAISRYLPC